VAPRPRTGRWRDGARPPRARVGTGTDSFDLDARLVVDVWDFAKVIEPLAHPDSAVTRPTRSSDRAVRWPGRSSLRRRAPDLSGAAQSRARVREPGRFRAGRSGPLGSPATARRGHDALHDADDRAADAGLGVAGFAHRTDSLDAAPAPSLERLRWAGAATVQPGRIDHELRLVLADRTVGGSVRFYAESFRVALAPVHDRTPTLQAPTGIAVFPRELAHVPRAVAERHANLAHWTRMPTGGHFAAAEEPDLLVKDLRDFFRPLR
jgi:hypothetical protein